MTVLCSAMEQPTDHNGKIGRPRNAKCWIRIRSMTKPTSCWWPMNPTNATTPQRSRWSPRCWIRHATSTTARPTLLRRESGTLRLLQGRGQPKDVIQPPFIPWPSQPVLEHQMFTFGLVSIDNLTEFGYFIGTNDHDRDLGVEAKRSHVHIR